MPRWSPPNADHPPPKAGEPPLHVAARTGDHDAITTLVSAGIPVDQIFDIALDPGARPEPATPLMVAAGSADGATAATLQLLLALGASIDPTSSGVTALWYASYGLGWNYPPGGDAERVAVLLAAGCDPMVTWPRGSTGVGTSVLARAARRGDPDRVRLLLEAGADPAPQTGVSFEVPLVEAARSGSAESVGLLLDAGAPVAQSDERADPPIAFARTTAVLELLLAAGADPNAGCGRGGSVVSKIAECAASVDERVDMLRVLQAAGVDLNSTANGPSALYHAAMGHAGAVEALLAAGADPHVEPSPLGAVCFRWCREPSTSIERIVDLLIDAGVDPNDTDRHGHRPLHGALAPDTFAPGYLESDGFNVSASVALLRRGASIDITFPETGFRPLHAAAAALSDIAIDALLAAGADPHERSTTGELPLDVARSALVTLRSSPPTMEQAEARSARPARAPALFDELHATHETRLRRGERAVELLGGADHPAR